MTSFNVFKILKNIQTSIFNNLRNALKIQQRIQINCDFTTFTTCFASNIFVLKFFLQFIFFNKRAVIDFVKFLFFSIKRFRLTSFVFNIRDRKSSASYVFENSFVNIRFIQSIIIKCESLKKKKNRFSKTEANIIKQKFTATEKKIDQVKRCTAQLE